jgi:molecular chaperone GrpE
MDDKEVIEPQDATAGAPSDEPFAAAEELSSDQIAALKEKADKAAEHHANWIRVSADLDNYRKRAARERQEAVKFANEALLEKLVPILDNFDMALAALTSAQSAGMESVQAGITMIHQQLRKVMSDAGLEEIDAAGKVFDPNFHEAISQQETADVREGHVVQQVRKGYKLRERLLRPAAVIVAKKPTA